jgi:hypothetical protein
MAIVDGAAPESLGPAAGPLERLPIPEPRATQAGIEGEVVHVDAFGNLLTNLPAELLPRLVAAGRLVVGDHEVRRVVGTYGEAPPGTAVALVGSQGVIEAAVVQGRADAALRRRLCRAVWAAWILLVSMRRWKASRSRAAEAFARSRCGVKKRRKEGVEGVGKGSKGRATRVSTPWGDYIVRLLCIERRPPKHTHTHFPHPVPSLPCWGRLVFSAFSAWVEAVKGGRWMRGMVAAAERLRVSALTGRALLAWLGYWMHRWAGWPSLHPVGPHGSLLAFTRAHS